MADRSVSAPDGWVPFSSRYGLVKEPWGRLHWTARHADHGIVRFSCCPPDQRQACACPGSGGARQCCEVATHEDLMCDACREHCVAVDVRGNYHSFVSVYGSPSASATTPPRDLGAVNLVLPALVAVSLAMWALVGTLVWAAWT